MRKITGFLLTVCILISASAITVKADEIQTSKYFGIITQEELCDVFPEYENRIQNLPAEVNYPQTYAADLPERKVE